MVCIYGLLGELYIEKLELLEDLDMASSHNACEFFSPSWNLALTTMGLLSSWFTRMWSSTLLLS
jgi:hypothetical protein